MDMNKSGHTLTWGSRVRVYTPTEVFDGEVVGGPGRVMKDKPKECFLVRPDSPEKNGLYGWYHFKQCRRLKQRRRWWLGRSPRHGQWVVFNEDPRMSDEPPAETVAVVEVKP